MAIPENAITIEGILDPHETIDFQFNASTILETGEEIASYSVVLGAEAAALGLEIGTSTRAPSLVNTNTAIRFWLTVNSGYRTNAAFNDPGTELPIEFTITTNSDPSRTRQRTGVVLTIQQ